MTRHDIPFYRVPVSRGGWGQPICTIEWSSPRVPLNLEGDIYLHCIHKGSEYRHFEFWTGFMNVSQIRMSTKCSHFLAIAITSL